MLSRHITLTNLNALLQFLASNSVNTVKSMNRTNICLTYSVLLLYLANELFAILLCHNIQTDQVKDNRQTHYRVTDLVANHSNILAISIMSILRPNILIFCV